jgi:hypothetical protein
MIRRPRRELRGATFWASGLALSLLSGCAAPPPDPGTALVRLRDPGIAVSQRVTAADEAVDGLDAGLFAGPEVWETLKTLAWSPEAPPALRRRAVELLVTRGVEDSPEDVRTFVRLRLPTEPDRQIVAELSRAAAQNGWTDATTAIVRRLAVSDDTDPNRRVEAAALLSLHPDRSLEATVFDVFVNPEVPAADDAARWRESVRGEVWELLGRLDRDASVRADLLASAATGAYADEVGDILGCLGRGVRELGIVPDTAAELSWLARLCEGSDATRKWWSESVSALQLVPRQRRLGLGLRHVEPVRWASLHRSGWLGSSRDELLDELRGRLDGRRFESRTAEMGTGSRARSRERLEDWEDRLRWSDVLAILVVDEALADPSVPEAIFRHAELDRRDRGTEYGGVFEAIDTVAAGSPGLRGRASDASGFRVVLFPPRTRDRVDDNRFVASLDMIRQSDRALAHHHQQVQRLNGDEFAGPSAGDLLYAARSGRTCVVLTSVGSGRINVDVYQPNGVVIDLGTILEPSEGGPGEW